MLNAACWINGLQSSLWQSEDVRIATPGKFRSEFHVGC